MAIVNSHGVDIDYEVLNQESDAIPVIFISGLGGLRSSWNSQHAAFGKHGPIVLHDHRGMGKSAKPKGVYSVSNMAGDVVAIMDAIGAEKAHFIGSSTGGAIIQVLCIDHPDRVQSGIICSSWAKADPYFSQIWTMRKKVLLEMGTEDYLRLHFPSLVPPKYFSEHYEDIIANEDERLRQAPPAEVFAERIDCILAHDELDRLGQIQTPVLVAVARDDQLAPLFLSEQLFAAIPGAELKVFEEGGHLINYTRTEEFNQVTLEFIERHDR